MGVYVNSYLAVVGPPTYFIFFIGLIGALSQIFEILVYFAVLGYHILPIPVLTLC